PIFPDELEPFITGGLGNFPYYWQDPRNNLFNIETYNWISANVKAGAYPIEQDTGSIFTNLTIQALGSVSYFLSTADQNALAADSSTIFNAQAQLLRVWKSAYGSIPPPSPTQEPVDKVIIVIATTWAFPATTFQAMLDAPVLIDLLNEVPPSGRPIIPVLVNYISVINASTSLQQASPSQSGYLARALEALQNPSLANGGLQTNNNKILPAYTVSTPLSDILEGLQKSSNSFKVKMKITKGRESDLIIETAGNESLEIDVDNFLRIPDISGGNIFTNFLENNEGCIEMDLDFSSLTMVYFEPVPFDKSLNKYWFWKEPLLQSVQNGNEDITGFEFSPTPLIDFSENGPYGFLTAVGISNFPNINMKLPEKSGK
ncbi:MAG: lamin tail domain-containing protein, partial [Saprospiraceae bacterium]